MQKPNVDPVSTGIVLLYNCAEYQRSACSTCARSLVVQMHVQVVQCMRTPKSAGWRGSMAGEFWPLFHTIMSGQMVTTA